MGILDLSKIDLEILIVSTISQARKRVHHLKDVLKALESLDRTDHAAKVEEEISKMIVSVEGLVSGIETFLAAAPRRMSSTVEAAAIEMLGSEILDTPKTGIDGPDNKSPLKTEVGPVKKITIVLCQYCDRECASGTGRAAHERHCPKNPNRLQFRSHKNNKKHRQQMQKQKRVAKVKVPKKVRGSRANEVRESRVDRVAKEMARFELLKITLGRYMCPSCGHVDVERHTTPFSSCSKCGFSKSTLVDKLDSDGNKVPNMQVE